MIEKLEAEIKTIKEGLAIIVTRLKEIEKAYAELPSQVKIEVELDASQLAQLPWNPFKKGKGEWIFSDKAKDLKLALLEYGSLEIGVYKYKLSGEDNRFINRFKVG